MFPVSCLKCSGTNTSPRIHAGDGKGFHYRALRRVVPEPWLLSQGGVHSQMNGLVLKVVTHRTHPFEAENFWNCDGFMMKRIKENYFVFIKMKDTNMRTN